MKVQLGFRMAIVFIVLALTVVPGLAQGSPEMTLTILPSDSFIWFVRTVDSSGDRGTHTSIVFDSSNGTPWISYYDEANGDLMVAHRVSSGGNCGPSNGWYCETVDSIGNVGQHSSIDVYPDPDPSPPNFRRVGVAYYDATGRALRFAEYSLGSWSAVTIDQGDTAGLPGYGLYTSIRYGTDGKPRIAYYAVRWQGDIIVHELRFAYRRDDNNGNCGASQWQCYTVNDGPGVGEYASMEITYVDSLVVPYIAYYDDNNGNLMLARYVGGGAGTGCSHPSWSCQMIDGASADVGQAVSLELTNGQYFAYYDATNGKLKYAYRRWSGGGNCGGGDYQCITIDDATSPAGARSISLAVDSADRPLIAYRYGSGLASQLRVAQPIVPGPSGNCGPGVVGIGYSWRCLTVDTESSTLGSVADHVSAAFDPDDLPMIAYSWHDFTMVGDDYDLKIAYGRRGGLLPLVLRDSP